MRKCTICGGMAVFMGILGRLRWYRCQCCGNQFSRASKAKQDDE